MEKYLQYIEDYSIKGEDLLLYRPNKTEKAIAICTNDEDMDGCIFRSADGQYEAIAECDTREGMIESFVFWCETKFAGLLKVNVDHGKALTTEQE